MTFSWKRSVYLFIIKILFTQARIQIFLTIIETLPLYTTNMLIGPFYCISFIYKYSFVWPLIMLFKKFYWYFYLKLIATGTECEKMTYCHYKNVSTCTGSFTKKITNEFIKMSSTFAFMCVDYRYTNADLKMSLYVLIHMEILLWKFVFLIPRILKLYTRKVFVIFVYKHTETVEYIKKYANL